MRPVTVLVVDDQAPFREAAACVVGAAAGFVALEAATSGEEALVVVRLLRPDLVLLDLNLPGMSGVEAARRISSDVGAPVIVLVSTYDVEDFPEDAFTCGAAAVLSKADLSPDSLRRLWQVLAPAGRQVQREDDGTA